MAEPFTSGWTDGLGLQEKTHPRVEQQIRRFLDEGQIKPAACDERVFANRRNFFWLFNPVIEFCSGKTQWRRDFQARSASHVNPPGTQGQIELF
jgi:hypothetical protein